VKQYCRPIARVGNRIDTAQVRTLFWRSGAHRTSERLDVMFVVIGTTTADILVRSHSPAAGASADGFRAGNVVFTQMPVRLALGGNGGISAYVLAGLGVPVALYSAVGNDALGPVLLAWLEARGVDVSGIDRSDDYATSTSVILAADAATQTVVHHLGATVQIRPDAVPSRVLADTDALLVSSYPLMNRMGSGGLAGLLERVCAQGGITAVDIGPALGVPVTLQELGPLLPHTQYLLGNTHEICRLTGTDDWDVAAGRLLDAGARTVVIKRGSHGASIRSVGTTTDVMGFEVDANTSVGAGDAFDAGFLKCVQRRLDPEQAMRFANAVAAMVVSADGGVLEAPTVEQVDAFLAAHA
jgi:sugar/nucleoside kinase (ribokinase family)